MDKLKQEITSAVGARIRHFRHMHNFSQEQVALSAGLNPAYYGQIERGQKCPTIDSLYRIALSLEVPLSELVRFDSQSTDSPINLARQLSVSLSRVPTDKREQVLRLIESIADLFQ